MHPIYAEIIARALYHEGTAKAPGSKHAHGFKSSLPDKPNELEIPVPVLALAATAVCVYARVCFSTHSYP